MSLCGMLLHRSLSNVVAVMLAAVLIVHPMIKK